MNIKDFLATSVGLYASEYIDDICDNFNIDPSDEDVRDVLGYNNTDFGNAFAAHLYEEVINKAVDELALDRDKFDYNCNGSLDTALYYDGEAVDSWDGLVEIAEERETE